MYSNKKASYSLEDLVGKDVWVSGVIIGAHKYPSTVVEASDTYVVLRNKGFEEDGSYGPTKVIPLHGLPSGWYKPVK